MGFKLIGFKDGGRESRALDDLDEISVEMDDGTKWKGSVGDFIGAGKDPHSAFNGLGSPEERLHQITGQYTALPKSMTSLPLSHAHPFTETLRMAEDRWARAVVPGDSKFSDRLRKAIVKEDLQRADLAESTPVYFNNPGEARNQVVSGIDAFCTHHPEWSADDVIAFNKAMNPSNGEQVESLYRKGEFTNQGSSGAMELILPTDETTVQVGDLLE